MDLGNCLDAECSSLSGPQLSSLAFPPRSGTHDSVGLDEPDICGVLDHVSAWFLRDACPEIPAAEGRNRETAYTPGCGLVSFSGANVRPVGCVPATERNLVRY